MASGTTIPIGTTGSYANGFTVASNVITASQTGTYYVSYQINTTAAVGVGMYTRVFMNGTAPTTLINRPALTTNQFGASSIMTINAGSTLELQFVGLAATVTLATSVGAVINIIRIA
ncbi:MAG: hypothetical protein FWD97_03025 [Defluviitaleaceae bacterium]|nr:hypothetical protein [Defluviitaleaceae bacterium]